MRTRVGAEIFAERVRDVAWAAAPDPKAILATYVDIGAATYADAVAGIKSRLCAG